MRVGRSAALRRRRTPAPGRGLVAALILLALLTVDALRAPPRAAAGPVPDEVLPGIVEAYGDVGTLGAVVARQHRRISGLSPRATDARAARTAEAVAGNAASERRFPTASTVKMLIAEELLHRARTGRIRLDDRDYDQMRRMMTASDDPAASALWVRHGGGQLVRDVARRYDLPDTTPPAVRGRWGETMTTARDLARFLSLLPVIAHPLDAAILMGWLSAATPIPADGFDQRFGVFGAGSESPAGGVSETAVKQGWMCCVDGRRHVHSVGVVGRTVVVLLSEVPRSVGYAAARKALTEAAAALPPPPGP